MKKKEIKLDHLHLITPTIEYTKSWYCKNLDAEVVKEVELEGSKVYYLGLGDFTIILIERLPGEEPLPATLQTRTGLDHFGLLVEDLDAFIKEFSSKGVPIHQGITTIRDGLRIAYIEAPDNVRIELLERQQNKKPSLK